MARAEPARPAAHRVRVAALLTGTAILLVVGWLVLDPRPGPYLAGRVAAARHDWVAAFANYADAWEADPAFLDVAARTGEAAARLAEEVPLADPAREVGLIRWFGAGGMTDELVATLEASRVALDLPDGSRRWIGRYEVTNAQYARFVATTGHRAPDHWSRAPRADRWPELPVVGVGWNDAAAYCAWAGGRLPAAVEWHGACAGPDDRTWPWGDAWTRPSTAGRVGPVDATVSIEAAWDELLAERSDALLPVGSACDAASADGILDLVGGVSEWIDGPGDPDRPLRGSSWLDRWGREDWLADRSRCDAQDRSHATASPDVGFRCAYNAP